MNGARQKGVVLHSGGLDSATVLAIARHEGFDPYALTVSYGQPNIAELDYARASARDMGVAAHVVMKLDLAQIGGTTPTPFAGALHPAAGDRSDAIVCYPGRNTLLLGLALTWMQTLGARHIFAGFNNLFNKCPDHSAEYLDAFEKLAGQATAALDGEPVRLHLPLFGVSKSDTIARGLSLGVDYGVTHTCCRSGTEGNACQVCHACTYRAQGFAELGILDPAFAAARLPSV